MVFHQIDRRIAANGFGRGDIAFRIDVQRSEISFIEQEEIRIQVIAESGKLRFGPVVNQIQENLCRTADPLQSELRLKGDCASRVAFQHRAYREVGDHAFSLHMGLAEPFDQKRGLPQMHIAGVTAASGERDEQFQKKKNHKKRPDRASCRGQECASGKAF